MKFINYKKEVAQRLIEMQQSEENFNKANKKLEKEAKILKKLIEQEKSITNQEIIKYEDYINQNCRLIGENKAQFEIMLV